MELDLTWLEAILNNSLLPIIFAAIIILFLENFFPSQFSENMRKRLIPIFIISICISISLLSINLSNIESIVKSNIDTKIESFSEPAEFDKYFDHILEKAQAVRIVHIGDYIPSLSSYSEKYNCNSPTRNQIGSRTYLKILESFLKDRSHQLIRISSIPKKDTVKDWLKCDLQSYGNSYELRITPIKTDNKIGRDDAIRTNGIILIDQGKEKIVILAGPHEELPFTEAMVVIINPNIYAFYKRYFDYLYRFSKEVSANNVMDVIKEMSLNNI